MWPGPSPPLVVLYCAAFWSWGALSYTAPIPPSFKSSRVLSLYPSEATVLPASLFGEDLCLLLEISVFNFLLLLSHHLHRPLHSLFFLRHRVPDAGLSVSYTTHLIQSPSNMLKVTGIQWQSLTPQTLALNHKFRATQPLDLPAQTSRQLSWPSLVGPGLGMPMPCLSSPSHAAWLVVHGDSLLSSPSPAWCEMGGDRTRVRRCSKSGSWSMWNPGQSYYALLLLCTCTQFYGF